jgi:hypothetical protein
MNNIFYRWREQPWLIFGLVGMVIIFVISPQEFERHFSNFTKISILIWMGSYADRFLFPYARPGNGMSESQSIENGWMLRRAIIIGATVAGGAMAI